MALRNSPSFSIRDQLREEPILVLLLMMILYMISGGILVPGVLAILELAFDLGPGDMQAILAGKFAIHESSRSIFRLAQISHQLLSWGFMAGIMAALLGNVKEQLALESPRHRAQVLIAALLLLVSIPFAQFLYLSPEQLPLPESMAEWRADMIQLEKTSLFALQSLLSEKGVSLLILNLLIFALVPAVCEEFFFRGILQRQLSEMMDIRWAILLTGLLFSLVHFQLSGLISRLWLGTLLGWLLWRSGSIWPGIVAHFVFNASLVSYAWWTTQQGTYQPTELVVVAWYWGLLSLAATLGLMWWFAKLSRTLLNSPPQ
ncbi:MAG: CPBP family intramembrane glutamic endopeptidase [Bacteroidota bacterium]